MTLDEQVTLLHEQYRLAALDTPEEDMDAGGWVDVANSVALLPFPEVTPDAVRIFLGELGLPMEPL